MLSRVADSIYWMFRYIERAENYARFLDVNFNLMLDLPASHPQQWLPLIAATGDIELFEAHYQEHTQRSAIEFLGFDTHNPNSIFSCLIKARENARGIKPELSRELWEEVNSLYIFAKNGYTTKVFNHDDPREYFEQIKRRCTYIYGLIDSTFSRSEGWYFAKLGQFLERADKTSRVLDVKYHFLLPSTDAVGTPFDLIHWAALLKSVTAYDMYRKKYGNLEPSKIVQFLILDRDFPRSILRCLIRAEHSLHRITGSSQFGYTNRAEKVLGLIRSQMEYADVADIFKVGLHEYLDHIQLQIIDAGQAIFDSFITLKDFVTINADISGSPINNQ